eukprot:365495-Chlamydomonas_euryale.AAC.2
MEETLVVHGLLRRLSIIVVAAEEARAAEAEFATRQSAAAAGATTRCSGRGIVPQLRQADQANICGQVELQGSALGISDSKG